MEELLISTLKSFGYPVIRQGSITEGENYPNSFFTFWNNNTYDLSVYNNKAVGCVWDFDINIYSTDPSLTYSLLNDARKILIEAGFIIGSKGHDIGSDEVTHTGRGMSALYIEMEE